MYQMRHVRRHLVGRRLPESALHNSLSAETTCIFGVGGVGEAQGRATSERSRHSDGTRKHRGGKGGPTDTVRRGKGVNSHQEKGPMGPVGQSGAHMSMAGRENGNNDCIIYAFLAALGVAFLVAGCRSHNSDSLSATAAANPGATPPNAPFAQGIAAWFTHLLGGRLLGGGLRKWGAAALCLADCRGSSARPAGETPSPSWGPLPSWRASPSWQQAVGCKAGAGVGDARRRAAGVAAVEPNKYQHWRCCRSQLSPSWGQPSWWPWSS